MKAIEYVQSGKAVDKVILLVIYPQGICYLKVGVKDVPEIVSQTIQENRLVDHLLYKDEKTGERIVQESEIPFIKIKSESCWITTV